MSLGNLNSDEFDTLFELVLLILFMGFGIFAIASMSRSMNERIEVIDAPDKISITWDSHLDNNPFYFTGYQAYMFAYHMDDVSEESLSWVGGKLTSDYDIVDGNIQSKQRLDAASHTNCVTLGIKDEDGNYITNWEAYRNQLAVGTGMGASKSVRKTINSLVNDSDITELYKGTLKESGSDRLLRFHLTLTDKYTTINDLGYSLIDGGKTFRWVLEPVYY